MTLHDHATRLQELAAGPAILDAVDQFYADDVVIVEATGESFTGKETQKERVREFMGSVARCTMAASAPSRPTRPRR